MSRSERSTRPVFYRRLIERIGLLRWWKFGREAGGDIVPNPDVVDTTPPGLQPEGDVVVALPGCNFPPRGAMWLDLVADADLGAQGGNAIVIQFPVPQNWNFRIEQIGFSAESELALGDLVWSVLSGGNAVPYFLNKSGVIGTLDEPARIFVEIAGQSTVQIQLTNSGLDTRHFVARIGGWFHKNRQQKVA